METVIRLEGMVAHILERLITDGYYKTKTEAIRAGILELGREYDLVKRSEADLVAERAKEMDEEVRSGKKRTYSIEEIANEAGVKI